MQLSLKNKNKYQCTPPSPQPKKTKPQKTHQKTTTENTHKYTPWKTKQNKKQQQKQQQQRAAEARQEKTIVEVVRKAIVARWSWSICWTHLQMFSVSTVVARRPPKWSTPEEHLPSFLKVAYHHIGQEEYYKKKATYLVSWLFCSLFVLWVCMGGWERTCEWMSLQCHSWAQTLDRGKRCLVLDLQCQRYRHHRAPRVRVTRSQDVGVFIEHIYKINVFCQYCPRTEGLRSGAASWSICPASWPSPTTTMDRKRTTKRSRHVWWVKDFALCLF